MFWNNKIVWITGASSGIGEELVCQIAGKGSKVILTSRNEKKLKEVAVRAGLRIENSMILPMDLTSYSNLAGDVTKVLEKFGRIDILINNAGVTQRDIAINTKLEVDESLMAVNYFGPVALTKAVLPHFVDQKQGHVVVTSSVAGKLSTPLRSAYCASKHALHGFFESLAAEVHDLNIKTTLICPGFINTNISSNALKGDGSRHAENDAGQAAGMSVQDCVHQYLKAIEKGKTETIISGSKEKFAIAVRRFWPGLFRRMVRKMKVT